MSHSLQEGIFPAVRSSPGVQARGRTPRWPEGSGRKERWDCSQGGAQVEVHPWEGPLHIVCPAGTSSPPQHLLSPGAATLHLPATSSLQVSGAHGHPWISNNIKQGHTPHCHIWEGYRRRTGRAKEETNAAAQTQCHG